jgi:hypothetical protein
MEGTGLMDPMDMALTDLMDPMAGMAGAGPMADMVASPVPSWSTQGLRAPSNRHQEHPSKTESCEKTQACPGFFLPFYPAAPTIRKSTRLEPGLPGPSLGYSVNTNTDKKIATKKIFAQNHVSHKSNTGHFLLFKFCRQPVPDSGH